MNYRKSSIISFMLILCILAVVLNASCIKRPFGKPPGESIGSCRGDMRLADGGRTRFVFDLFKQPNEEFTLYVSFPGKWVRYEPVKDISFENGVLRIETANKKAYEGEIIGGSLKIKGSWGKYSGTLSFELDE
ncbi:hypothetical protein LLG96_15765 [bacterium]|nr:hypothetical protein [bacterium]